ncbi:hypothetical protein NMY22_g15047 [Coprinellus aureogranulatus]|nr:hypothetical protein NMY22_g15047 [Coprinellus aureogranulatus]
MVLSTTILSVIKRQPRGVVVLQANMAEMFDIEQPLSTSGDRPSSPSRSPMRWIRPANDMASNTLNHDSGIRKQALDRDWF